MQGNNIVQYSQLFTQIFVNITRSNSIELRRDLCYIIFITELCFSDMTRVSKHIRLLCSFGEFSPVFHGIYFVVLVFY